MRRAILLFALISPLIAVALWRVSIPLAVGTVFVSHMLVLYPTLRARSQWLGPVYNRFETIEREVWLTIDDGPDADDTLQILETLRQHKARATFFVKGMLAENNHATAEKIVADGHELANHSHTHPSGSFWCLPPGRIEREIIACNDAIARLSDSGQTFFRAPVGMKNPFVHPILERLDMKLIGWSARGFDGVPPKDAERVVDRIVRDIRPGAIILLHQGVRSEAGERLSPRIIELVLDQLSQRGYECVIPHPDSLRA